MLTANRWAEETAEVEVADLGGEDEEEGEEPREGGSEGCPEG